MVEDAADPEDREWRFSVDEVGPDDPDVSGESEAGGDAADDGDPEHGAAGSLTGHGDVEPETPTLENAVFVAIGAYIGVVGVVALFVDPLGFDLLDLVVLTVGMALGTLALFGYFGLLNPDT